MKKFLLDPNILYAVGTKMWSVELGDCVIEFNNNSKEYPYCAINNKNKGLSFDLSGRYADDSIYPSLFLSNPFDIESNVIKLENRKVLVWDNDTRKRERTLLFKYKDCFFCYREDSDTLEDSFESWGGEVALVCWDYCSELPTPKTKLTKKQICDMFSIADFDLVD